MIDDNSNNKVKKEKHLWYKKWLLQKYIYSHMNLLNKQRTTELIDFKTYL